MGIFDSPRRKLVKLVEPHLQAGESIDGGLAYGTTRAYGAWAMAVLKRYAPGAAVGVVVTSRRVFIAEWNLKGRPRLVLDVPRADVRATRWKRGLISASVTLQRAGAEEVNLFSSGAARGDAEDLADLLR